MAENHPSDTTNQAFICLGSNLGNRQQLIKKAVTLIQMRCGSIERKSGLYESAPWGFDAENWFINQVILLNTALPAVNLLQKLMEIEQMLGRVRKDGGYDSRSIDLDILYFGDKILNTNDLEVPHPRLHLRRFTLLPLCEIAPDFIHPVLKHTQRELLEMTDDFSEVRTLGSTLG